MHITTIVAMARAIMTLTSLAVGSNTLGLNWLSPLVSLAAFLGLTYKFNVVCLFALGTHSSMKYLILRMTILYRANIYF